MTDDESEGELVYVVITEADGPFREGELLVCADVPGGHAREIGAPSRKPIKWHCQYERFRDPAEAVRFRERQRVDAGLHWRAWVPGGPDE